MLFQKFPASLPIYNRMTPSKGPKCLIVAPDFVDNASYEIDLTAQSKDGTLEIIQSAWIDNYDNPQPLVMTVSGTQQRIKVPANSAGLYPILMGPELRFTLSTTQAANLNVKVIVLNIDVDTR